jgi:imidazole glycerol-phosphate synthase subunit HisF
VPITAGGGIRSLEDARLLLRNGADKIAINTAAVRNPQILTHLSEEFGSSSIVLSVEAKSVSRNRWEVYTESGREKTGIDVLEWAKKGESLGVGELLVTSIDYEGTERGYDFALLKAVSEIVDLPVIASGGMGDIADLKKLVPLTRVSGAAIASVLHYGKETVTSLREKAIAHNLGIRQHV